MQISFNTTFTIVTILCFIILPWNFNYFKQLGKKYKVRYYERFFALLVYILPIFNTYVLYSGAAVYLYNRDTFLFLPILFEPIRAPELINLTWSILLYSFFIRGSVLKLSYFIRFHLTHSILLNILQGFIDQILFDLLSPKKRKVLLGKVYIPMLEPFFNDPRSPYYISNTTEGALKMVLQSSVSVLVLSVLAFYLFIIFEAIFAAYKGKFNCRQLFLKAIIFYIGDQRKNFEESKKENRDKK